MVSSRSDILVLKPIIWQGFKTLKIKFYNMTTLFDTVLESNILYMNF